MTNPQLSCSTSNDAKSSAARWVRLLFRQRPLAVMLSGTLVAAATAALCPVQMNAGQNPDDGTGGMMIMPRGGDVSGAPLPAWRQPVAVAPVPSGPGTISAPAMPARATLKAPVFAGHSQMARSAALNQGGQGYNFARQAGLAPGGVSSTFATARGQETPVPEIPLSAPGAPVPAAPIVPTPGNDQAAPLIESVPPLNGPAPLAGHSMRPRRVAPPAPGTSGFRATVEADAPGWIGPYMGRTGMLPSGTESSPTPAPTVQLPSGFTAWWDPLVREHAGIAPQAIPVDVTSLVQQALIHSPRVQVLQADPEVQLRVVRQEEAAFDWRAFLDTRYDDLNDPIGNTLTTGNNDNRFTDNKTNASAGVKKRTQTGGELKVSQQVGHQYNNSRFLLPNPQATSRLELSFRQPLLNHAGDVYNQNQIILARINANVASDETLEELQSHLFGVAEAYWKLYRARAEFFQRQKLLASAQKVLVTLEGRNQVDTIPRQILRARAAVARAESRMQRAVTDIRNAESQLRLLVNDPEMLNNGPVEFTPTESPSVIPSPVGLRESLQTALTNRPDISEAIRQMRAAGVRLGVSKNEMLPKLDFIVSSYVAGLQNQTQFADAIGDQYTLARPGYTVGLEFEVPLGNRMAKARLEQRQWELKRAINGFRTTVETSLTEVEISSREVETSWRELLGKYQAMVAAQNEVAYLQDRFNVLPMIEESSMLLLEDLLDGYERLADEESAFAQAQANYALSIIQLRRATGTLMRSRHDAPELQADETEWMQARADLAAEESTARSKTTPVSRSRSENRRTAESEVPLKAASFSEPPDGQPKATWSQPVGEKPSGEERSSRRNADSGPRFFGHSMRQ